MAKIIGIDLGTTNSVVAVLVRGETPGDSPAGRAPGAAPPGGFF